MRDTHTRIFVLIAFLVVWYAVGKIRYAINEENTPIDPIGLIMYTLDLYEDYDNHSTTESVSAEQLNKYIALLEVKRSPSCLMNIKAGDSFDKVVSTLGNPDISIDLRTRYDEFTYNYLELSYGFSTVFIDGENRVAFVLDYEFLDEYLESTKSMPNFDLPHRAENGDFYNFDNDGDGRREPIRVRGYYKTDGTYVREHYRAQPGK